MDWKELKIYTSHENIENLSAALIAAGVSGLVIDDPEDIKEFAAERSDSWDYIDEELLKSTADKEPCVTLYISDDPDGAQTAEAVNEALQRLSGLGIACRPESSSIREEDWANEWKKFFKPQPIGKRILIKPSWETVSDPQGRKIIELDPENSFGTGRHHTTRLCLELMEKYLAEGDRVADLGCGSGIIFICAMALGASYAFGTDISPDAIKISAKNALNNGIFPDSFTVLCGDAVTDPELRRSACQGFDLVTANIVADVLLHMKELFKDMLRPAGKLVLSGIIDDRLDEVLEAVKAQGFTLVEQRHADIWNAAVFIKDQPSAAQA